MVQKENDGVKPPFLTFVKDLMKYINLWWILTLNAAQITIASRFGALIFLLGKFLRFGFFFFFLSVLLSRANNLAGYNATQVFFFYLSFNLIDSIPQLLFREVYRFRQQVLSGSFDYYLVKPISVLFRSLFGGSDLLDIPLTIIIIVLLFIVGAHLHGITLLTVFAYICLLINAIFIATAFHIGVLCLGVLTTEVDNAIMLYRDFTQMGRFPIDIYKEPLRGVLTFIIPVGIMMTVPPKVLMGIFTWNIVAISFTIGIILFLFSVFLWKYALRTYASASS